MSRRDREHDDASPRFRFVPPFVLLLPALVAVLVTVLAFLLGGRGGGGGSASPVETTRQITYRTQLEADRAALLPALLRYPPVLVTDVGDPATLTVRLDLGEASAGDPEANDSAEAAVLAGGLVGVRLAGDREVTVDAQSPERQPVVAPGDRGTWRYAVTAPEPGERELVLTVVTYREGTDEPLSTSGPFVVRFEAEATLGYRLRQVSGAVAGLLAFAGVSGGVALTWLWRRLRRRNTPATTPPPEPPPPEQPAPEQPAP